MLAIHYSFIYPYLTYGIEFWGCARQKYLQKLLVLQRHCIGLISHAPAWTHCVPIVSNHCILFLEDSYKFLLSCYMYKVYHNTANVVINSMLTKVESVNLGPTR